MEYFKVSYSSLNLLDACMRKFEFQKMYPRRVRDDEQFAADVGTALHQGLQTYLSTGSEIAAQWALLESYPWIWAFNQTRDDRSIEACISTLDEMIIAMDMSDWELMTIRNPEGNVVPAIEVPFEVRLKGLELADGRGVAFTGFMDAAMRHRNHGTVRTLDIKTNRRQREDADPVYRFNTQQLPYGICLEHIQGHSVADFEVLYLDCYIDLLNPRVHMYPYVKDSEDVQDWLVNTVMKVKRIQQSVEMDYFPRTDGGCLSWNKPCWFLDICQTRDKEVVTDWLLNGEEADTSRSDIQPWIVAEIDVFGGEVETSNGDS